ncbi:MAG: MFS transporter [Chloroflexi bacterium]|nr:MFS transporter [Chloroflexota bacterium]
MDGKRILGFNRNVFFMGLTSLLTDVSSEMVFTIVPLFLANVLGAATTIVGLVGGLSDSIDAVFRIFSGWFSDRIGKRKLLAVTGYGFSTLSKPFMYIASIGWGVVLGVRIGDRIGKGIRSAPRDALIADSVGANERGKSFGLHKAMDTSGAFIGLVIAAIIVYLVQGSDRLLELRTYQWLVIVGVIPAVLAVMVLLFFVHERRVKHSVDGATRPSFWSGFGGFSTRFKIFVAIMGIFTLGNSSDFFLILRAQNLEAPLIQVVLMLVLFNATYATISIPMGVLSDRLGRRRVLALGWFIYALVYFGFALATQMWQAWVLFAIYGLYYGVVEGVGKAFVADLVPKEKRGAAYGLYQGVISLALLPASLIAGFLWDTINPAAAFYFGAGLAFLAMLGIMTLIKERPVTSEP